MIGAVNKTYKLQKDIKEVASFTISGSVIEKLNAEMQSTKISKSEIVEFALRKLFGIDTNMRANPLNEVYK